jgi:hypothetical protein
MALQQIDLERQSQDQSLPISKLFADFLGGSNWNITNSNNNATISGLAAGTANNDAVNKGQMDAAIASALTGAMNYKGTIDASDATGAALDGALQGDFYLVSVAGTLDGIAFNIGDHLVVNSSITDFDVDGAGKIDIIDNTEAADILRTADIVDDLVTGGTNKVLSAQQGVVLKGLVDGVQSELDTTQAGAGLETDGTYVADGTADYISAATSLKNADSLLDDQIKVNADAIGVNAGNISTNASNITDLQNQNAQRVFGEEYAPVANSTSYTVANPPIDAGTLRVYINGIREREGAGNAYTFVAATGVITFNDTIKGNKDVILVDYEYTV